MLAKAPEIRCNALKRESESEPQTETITRTVDRHLGQRHLDYLKQYRSVTYTNLLTSGKLNTYLADIDRQAQERFERLIEGMKQVLKTPKGRKCLRMGTVP